MNSEVVLEVDGEGGSITLRRGINEGQNFWVEVDESQMYETGSEEVQGNMSARSRSDLTPSFEGALEQLDRYPWIELQPILIHQSFRAAVLHAVRSRIGATNDVLSAAILQRWSALAGGVVAPASPSGSTDTSLIRKVVNQTAAKDWVAERIRYADQRHVALPSKEEFWKQLALALLTSQQRSTQGSATDLFAQREPFPLSLEIFVQRSDDDLRELLKSFRFGSRVTDQLRANYKTLFGDYGIWDAVRGVMKELVHQRELGSESTFKHRERQAAHLLADNLSGIGPKQSRNILQELGLTRYEIPLDSRVVGWLSENLGWNIPASDLSDAEHYEFWLDRLQAVCKVAGVVPTIFDAAAFDVGRTLRSRTSATTLTGYVNRNGQVVIRNTRLPGTDYLQWVYQLGCSQCGYTYGANGSDIFQRKCPACQRGSDGIPFGDTFKELNALPPA